MNSLAWCLFRLTSTACTLFTGPQATFIPQYNVGNVCIANMVRKLTTINTNALKLCLLTSATVLGGVLTVLWLPAAPRNVKDRITTSNTV